MIHVCFAVYDEAGTFSKFAGTAMLSVFENISKPLPSVTVHILHDNTLTDDNRNKFSYLVGRCGQRVKFYNVEKLFEDSLEEIINLFANVDKTYFNKATFYKFFIPRALPSNVEKAIYLEPNVLVNTDINELWRVPLDDKILAAVPAISIDPDLQAQDKIIADGFVKKEDYFSSVVMLMNLKLLGNEIRKRTQLHKPFGADGLELLLLTSNGKVARAVQSAGKIGSQEKRIPRRKHLPLRGLCPPA